MKKILFILLTLSVLFVSCNNHSKFEILSTGEKVVMVDNIYSVGDTVVLRYSANLGTFQIDRNWYKFTGLDTTTIYYDFYKAKRIE
jgi:hypothetical protein